MTVNVDGESVKCQKCNRTHGELRSKHDLSIYLSLRRCLFLCERFDLESREESNNGTKECRCHTRKVIVRSERHFGINLFINETRHGELHSFQAYRRLDIMRIAGNCIQPNARITKSLNESEFT